jgi:membrane-associated HD superfamily phosphohydrolase
VNLSEEKDMTMTPNAAPQKNPSDQTRRRSRLLAVAVAVAATVVVWIVAALAGVALEVTSPLVGTIEISALLTIASALPLALAAWAVLALLERLTANARRTWTIIAAATLALSLPPLAFLEATLTTKLVLGLMHIAAGLILIGMLRRSAVNDVIGGR